MLGKATVYYGFRSVYEVPAGKTSVVTISVQRKDGDVDPQEILIDITTSLQTPQDGNSFSVILNGKELVQISGLVLLPGDSINIKSNPVPKSEQIGTGNGTTTSFSGTLLRRVVPRSVEVNYRIAGVNYTATDDGAGNITGTNISSGTVNYTTGNISITFSSPPDNGSTVTVNYRAYTTILVVVTGLEV